MFTDTAVQTKWHQKTKTKKQQKKKHCNKPKDGKREAVGSEFSSLETAFKSQEVSFFLE